MKVHVINGPNLNLLGTREPEIYGHDTLEDVANRCRKSGDNDDLDVLFSQSNHEGQIVTWIQEAINKIDAIVLNAGAYTHTSIAIHDALRAYNGFVIELHISNPHLREPFRHLSYVSSAANAVIAGLGIQGYERSIEMIAKLRDQTTIFESR